MASCKDCKDRIQYDIDLISAFAERTIKRLWIVILILIILLVGSNGMWLYYESQFEDVSQTVEAVQDGEGTNIVGGGDINYGAESKDNH